MFRKIFTKKTLIILVLLSFISIASAAVYITFNPEARIYFDRPQPGPDVLPVQSSVQMENDMWTNSYSYGTMTGDVLEVNMMHKNGDVSDVNGIVYFELECTEGLVNSIDGSGGIRDFESITFTDPTGNIISCNNGTIITRLSDTSIRIIPTLDTYPFEYGIDVPTYLNIKFIGMAYGNYILWVFVDEPEAI